MGRPKKTEPRNRQLNLSLTDSELASITARALAVDQRLDLAVAPHAVGQTLPARALSRRNDRTDKRENAGRLRDRLIC